MTSPMARLAAELGERCDRRTQALHKAVDALEEMREILFKSRKKWNDKERLLYTICEKSLEQIEMHVEDNGNNKEA